MMPPPMAQQVLDREDALARAQELIADIRALVRKAKPRKDMTYRDKVAFLLGGPGSGNFGHEGRPGEVGGSAIVADWGDDDAEPPPTWARSNEVSTLHTALFDQARNLAGEDAIDRMADEGLSQYEIKQWIRGGVKAAIHRDLTARVRKDPAFAEYGSEETANWVQSKIDLWAETAGDHDAGAVMMQHAVQQEFGLEHAETQHMDEVAYAVNGKEMARLRAFVRAEYERTQEFFKAKGVTHVSVIRGMRDKNGELGYGYETVSMQPASSWTTNVDTALSFALEDVEQGSPKVLTSRVPISQVLSTCVTGRGCLPEEEVILLGKPQRAQVFGLPTDDDEDGNQVEDRSQAGMNRLRARVKQSMQHQVTVRE